MGATPSSNAWRRPAARRAAPPAASAAVSRRHAARGARSQEHRRSESAKMPRLVRRRTSSLPVGELIRARPSRAAAPLAHPPYSRFVAMPVMNLLDCRAIATTATDGQLAARPIST